MDCANSSGVEAISSVFFVLDFYSDFAFSFLELPPHPAANKTISIRNRCMESLLQGHAFILSGIAAALGPQKSFSKYSTADNYLLGAD